MPDKEARAVGAGELVQLAGRTFEARPLSIKQLTELEREATRTYKREYVKTFVDNADLMGVDPQEEAVKRLQEAAKWDVGDLPKRLSADVRKTPLTQPLRAWLAQTYSTNGKATDAALRALLATAIDSGELTTEEYVKLEGIPLRQQRVPYVAWWVTASLDAMATMLWLSLRQTEGNLTREEVLGLMTLDRAGASEFAGVVEKLTTPDLGNT